VKLIIVEATAAVRAEVNAAAAMELAAVIAHYEHRLLTVHAKTAAAVENTDALTTAGEAEAWYRAISMELCRGSSAYEEPWLAALPSHHKEDMETRLKVLFITIVVLCV
jgi:hypothetical protein